MSAKSFKKLVWGKLSFSFIYGGANCDFVLFHCMKWVYGIYNELLVQLSKQTYIVPLMKYNAILLVIVIG